MKKKKYCKILDLKEKNFVVKWIDEFKDEVIVYRTNGKIHVRSSVCPHFGGPIQYNIQENYLYCSWHGLKFSTDGACLNSKKFKSNLKKYTYELKNNNIFVLKNENN